MNYFKITLATNGSSAIWPSKEITIVRSFNENEKYYDYYNKEIVFKIKPNSIIMMSVSFNGTPNVYPDFVVETVDEIYEMILSSDETKLKGKFV